MMAGCTSPQESTAGPGVMESAGNGTGSPGKAPYGKRIDPNAWEGLSLPPGVIGEVVVANLTYPTSVDWDDAGRMYVGEAGIAGAPPRILRIGPDGSAEPLDLSGTRLTNELLDITHHNGTLYFTTRGIVHAFDLDRGGARALVQELPARGDHGTNEVVVGPDGRLYFGQGSVTNSGVVGLDQGGVPDAVGDLIHEHAGDHDVPCADIRLAGANHVTANPLAGDVDIDALKGAGDDVVLRTFATRSGIPAPAWSKTGERATTGAFVPFATPTYTNQTVPGRDRCNGAVLSVLADGSDLRVEAWGFRNPFGIRFDDDGTLLVADNRYDNRGSRPVGSAPDELFRVRLVARASAAPVDPPAAEDGAPAGNTTGGPSDPAAPGVGNVEDAEDAGGPEDAAAAEDAVGAEVPAIPWFGWPDYSVGRPLDDPFFTPLHGPAPAKLLLTDPNLAPRPMTFFSAHASANKFDRAPPSIPYAGDLFVAEFGTLNLEFVRGARTGMDVARVAADTGRVTAFITGADRFSGTFRPVEAAFGPDDRLYVVDFGPWVVERADASSPGLTKNVFHPSTGRVLAFDLSAANRSWEGPLVGNPGGRGDDGDGGSATPPDRAPVIEAFEYGYGPVQGTAAVGIPVVFRNVGTTGHTVTSPDGLFHSGFDLVPGSSYAWIPDRAGSFAFTCIVHPVMRGVVAVAGDVKDARASDGSPIGTAAPP